MTRRTLGLLVTLALGFCMAPPAADAPPAGKVAHIGLLLSASSTMGAPFIEVFRQSLRELGYVEGTNVALEIRSAEGHYERFPALAAELVQARVDVLVAGSTTAGYALQQATSSIPIVLIGTVDPVASGLATSLARPGHNITGVLASSPELVGKWLELLKAAVPGASRIAVLWNPANPAHRLGLSATASWGLRPLPDIAQALGVTLQQVMAQSPDEIEGAFRAMAASHADALVVVAGSGLLDAPHPDCGLGARAPFTDDL